MMFRIRYVVPAVLVVALLAAAWLGNSGGSGGDDAASELRVAVTSFAGELTDPIHGGLGMSSFQGPMYDYLVGFDREMRIVPALAERWTISPDRRSYTFELRSDVEWHNGDPFDADDVRHHFDVRLRDATAPYSGQFLQKIERIEVLGSHTIRFTLREAWPDFLAHLSPGNTTLGAITPRRYIEEVGERAFAREPVGTGPYELVEHERGSYFRYRARSRHAFREQPAFEYLKIMLVPEESTRIAMLRRGEVDLIETTPDSVEPLRRLGYQPLRIPDSYMAFVAFVGIWEPRAEATGAPTRMSQTGVRRALSLAIDRQAITEHLLADAGRPAALFPVFPGGYGWSEAAASVEAPYDPERARRLLAEAGYDRGFRLKLYAMPLPGFDWSRTLAEVIAHYWREVGVEVDLVSMEIGAALPVLYSRPDSALGSAFVYRTTRSVFPIGVLQNYVVAEGPAQFAILDWPERYAELNAVTEPGQRERAFEQFAASMGEQNALIPLFYGDMTFAARPDLEGWEPVTGWPSIGFSLEQLSLEPVRR